MKVGDEITVRRVPLDSHGRVSLAGCSGYVVAIMRHPNTGETVCRVRYTYVDIDLPEDLLKPVSPTPSPENAS